MSSKSSRTNISGSSVTQDRPEDLSALCSITSPFSPHFARLENEAAFTVCLVESDSEGWKDIYGENSLSETK